MLKYWGKQNTWFGCKLWTVITLTHYWSHYEVPRSCFSKANICIERFTLMFPTFQYYIYISLILIADTTVIILPLTFLCVENMRNITLTVWKQDHRGSNMVMFYIYLNLFPQMTKAKNPLTLRYMLWRTAQRLNVKDYVYKFQNYQILYT